MSLSLFDVPLPVPSSSALRQHQLQAFQFFSSTCSPEILVLVQEFVPTEISLVLTSEKK